MTVVRFYERKTSLSKQEVNDIIAKIPADQNPLFYILSDSSILGHYEHIKERLEIVKTLLERNPELAHSINQGGETPLSLAMVSGDIELIKLLTAIDKKQKHPSML